MDQDFCEDDIDVIPEVINAYMHIILECKSKWGAIMLNFIFS